MRRGLLLQYYFCLLLLSGYAARAQTANLYFHHFDKNSGVPQTVCNSIFKDSRGFAWLTTNSGLYRFDGTAFTDVFKNNELLKSHALKDIKEDKKGIFWLTKNDDELVRYDPYKDTVEIIGLRSFIKPLNVQVQKLNILHIDEDNRLWLGINGRGILCYDIKTQNVIALIPSVEVSTLPCIFFDNKHVASSAIFKWISGTGVIYRGTFSNKNNIAWETKKHAAIRWSEFSYASDTANVWLIHDNALVQYNWHSNSFNRHDITVPGRKQLKLKPEIYHDNKGRLWLRFEGGIAAFDIAQKKITRSFLNDPSDPYSVKYGAIPLLCDDEENLWLTSFGEGFSFCNLNAFRLQHFLNKGAAAKVGVSNFIRALATDNNGNIYFSSESYGVSLLDSNGNYIKQVCSEPGYSYETLYRDKSGKIWAGGRDIIIYDPFQKNIIKKIPPSVFGSHRVSSILQLQNGLFLIGTYLDLLVYDIRTQSCELLEGIHERMQIFSFLFELPNKDLLVGQRDRGVKRYRPKGNGYELQQDIHPYLFVKSCLQVNADELWLATTLGLYRYKISTGQLQPLTEINNKLPDPYLYALLQDNNGYYWVSSNNGLFRWKENDYKGLGSTEGVQGSEFNTNAFCRADDGSLYFGGVNGINKIEVNTPQTLNEYGARIQLLRLMSGDTIFLRPAKQYGYDSVTIDPGNSSVEIDYAAINFFQPGKYKVQYRLKNYNDSWQIAEGRGTARFVNIKPGTYLFEIRLYNPDNLQAGNIHHVPLYMMPYWWQTSLFKWTIIIFSILTIAAFVVLFFRYRLRRERMQLEKQLAIQQERERIVSDLHDDIGATLSSMNIYGDLAGNIWDEKPEESKKLVEKISVTSKELMGRMGDIIWSMKQSDYGKYTLEARLKNYCNELLSPKNIVCEFNVDATLATSVTKPEIRKNILLIAKEAINNIAKYSEATKATIELKREKDIALFSIQDNGKGFDNLQNKQGNGLRNMEQRCKVIGGEIQVNSNAGSGVHIICHFPIANISHTG
jgi:signal transduction histidine kinase/ligand-binding sensor domain-containing protein